MSSPYNITYIDGSLFVIHPDGTAYTAGGPATSNCTVAACPIELSVYGYRPTFPGSVAVIALYAICMVIQMVMGFRYRTWGFMTAMILGCISEIIGYVGRILYWQNPWNNAGFIIQIVLITFAPVFFAAAIYVMIYKIINYIDPSKSRFKPMLIYALFIAADILSLILQAVGGSMSATSEGTSSAGVNIALAGLCFQVFTLAVFSITVIDYLIRVRHTITKYGLSKRFKIFAAFLTLALVTIFIRCCYRVYELSEGYNSESEALRDQPLFIGLEMIMVVVAAYALIVAHPGPVFNRGIAGPAEMARSENQQEPKTVNDGSE